MSDQSDVSKHYGLAAISQSLLHFLVGKGFKIFSSLGILVLLARSLTQQQYAVYISLQALVTIIGVIASFGIQAVLFRYLPELRAAGNNLTLYRLLRTGITLRIVIVALYMLVILYFIEYISAFFELSDWTWLIPWYFGIGLIHLGAFSLSQALESLLWQKEAQYSLAIGGMLKLLAIVLAIMFTEFNLVFLVKIEACTEGFAFVLLIVVAYRRWKSDQSRTHGDLGWWGNNRKRVVRYGLWGFLLNQTNALYGSAPNRLVGAHYLATAELAILGFADTLTNLARRFMPTRLLLGFIRPIFMARYSVDGDFAQLVDMSNFVYRLNLMIFILPISLLLVVGEPVFAWITAGKYGAAAPLLAGFLILMVTEGLRALLELLVQAVEKNQLSVFTNIIQSLSLLIAIPLFPHIGAWALIIANVIGTVLANILVIYLLKQQSHDFKLDKRLVLLIVSYGVASGLIGWLILKETGIYTLSAIVIVICYFTCFFINLPFKTEEVTIVTRILSRKFKKSAKGEAT